MEYYKEDFSVHLDTVDDDVKFKIKYAVVYIIDDDCKLFFIICENLTWWVNGECVFCDPLVV